MLKPSLAKSAAAINHEDRHGSPSARHERRRIDAHALTNSDYLARSPKQADLVMRFGEANS